MNNDARNTESENTKMFDRVIKNAFDFLQTAIDGLANSPKYSVINFCSAIELFLKARLLLEHWSLILIEPSKADITKFRDGEFRSVDINTAIKRLKNVADQRISPAATDCFDQIRVHRNKLVHFFHSKYTGQPDQATISEVVAEQCKAWMHLHRLLSRTWSSEFRDYQELIGKLDTQMHKHREFLETKYQSIKTSIKSQIKEGVRYIVCTSCGFLSGREDEINTPLYENLCEVCRSYQRYLRVPCPDCGNDILYRSNEDAECSSCSTQLRLTDIFDMLEDRLSESHGRFWRDNVAYCQECENQEPCVVELDSEWICLSCLNQHSRPEHCDWCNELVTGDLRDSYLYGCMMCNGRLGWKDD